MGQVYTAPIDKTALAKVIFDYTKENDDELTLTEGDMVKVLSEEEEGWWKGELHGRIGVFPSNFVELVTGSVPVRMETKPEPEPSFEKPALAKVIFHYTKKEDDELTLTEGDMVKVLSKEEEGWWKGELQGRIGVFPSNFVELVKSSVPVRMETKPEPEPSFEEPASNDKTALAKVIFHYTNKEDDELTLTEGDMVNVLSEEEEGWWKGELHGRIGVFPANFVELVKGPVPVRMKTKPVPEPSFEEPDKRSKVINWTKSSIKHRAMFEKLVKVLETEPSKATQIGTYTVCLDADFVVGRGSDGTTVYIGLCDDGSEVAVKTLLIDRCKELGPNEKEILNTWYVRKEHHIVNYRYYTEKVDSRLAYLVLDLCEESLKEYVLSKERTKDTLKTDGPKLMREILYGLKALHCGKPAILHRDLKPSNIFMNVQGEVVLADFGISRKLGEGQTTHKSSERGAEGWIAVESLPREDEQDSPSDVEISVRYKKSSDVQVAGMVFFYILTKGVHPYGKRIYQNINLMEDKPVNLYMLDDFMAKDLINWMLRHSPNDRPSVEECLKHPYLISADDRFRFLTRVGNEPEIKSKDTSSPVVQQLNDDPSLPKPSWSVKIDADVMAYISGKRSYTDDVADLLRFIRNTSEHWNDKPPPAIVANLVGTPKDYFLKLFPSLPVVLHRIIRKSPDWSQRDELKQFF